MTRLDDAALGELARLAGEASPGEWRNGYDPAHYDAPEVVAYGYRYFVPYDADALYIAAANPATVAALVAEVRQLRQCLAGVRHSVQMSLAGLQDEPAFAVPLVVRGLGQTIDAIDAALDGGQ